MGAARLPSWRFIIPLLAGVAAIAALSAITMKAHPSVLIEDKAAEPRPDQQQETKAPEKVKKANDLPQIPGMGAPGEEAAPAGQKAAAAKMFKYLSKESYTPEDEKKYLAEQLGVKATDKPDIWTLPNGQVLKNADEAAQSSGLNVPYFSTYLLPQPHFTRGGMHDATRFIEQQRASQGLTDDDGRYLSKNAGKKLSQELTHSIDDLFVQTVKQIYPQRQEGPPISKASDEQLAAQLQQGEAYAFLPNHGAAPAARPQRVVSRAAGAKLAQELLHGEAEALAVPKPLTRQQLMGPGLSARQDSRLARSLEAAQAWAQLPNHGRPMQVKRRMFSPEQVAEDKELAADLEAGERYAAAQKVASSMHTDRKLAKELQQGLHQVYGNTAKIAQEWGIKPRPTLSLAQDKNVAHYLNAGIDKVWPAPKPKVRRFLSPQAGQQLVSAGYAAEEKEFAQDHIPTPRFLSADRGPALARELGSSLALERHAQGPYVQKYYARMQGKEAAHPAPRPFVTHGMTSKQLLHTESAAQVANKRLAESLQEGLDYYDKMKHLAKAKKGRRGPRMLSHAQGRALADYLLPAMHTSRWEVWRLTQGSDRNEAPALGYAV